MRERDIKLRMIREQHTLIVGVDVAKRKHHARMMDSRTGWECGHPFTFQNNITGFSRLLGRISRTKEEIGATNIIVAVEPSGHYWKPLAWYLSGVGITVVLVNPYHVKRSKELDDNTPTKNDRKDAWVIASLAAEGRFFRCYLPQGVWAELRSLGQARRRQRARLSAARVALVVLLDEYFPEFGDVFKNPLGKGALYILQRYPWPVDLRALPVERITHELKQATSGRVGQKRAVQLLAVARDSVGVTEGLDAARLRLGQVLAEIRFWQGQLTQTEEAMARALQATGMGAYLLSIPGVGVVTAAVFLSEVGDMARYTDWRQLRRLAGYNLTENSSGQKKGRTQISKRGRPGLRSILYQAAVTLVAKNKEFGALYRYLRTRRENPLAGPQALVAVACKLLRVIFALVKKREMYDPQKVLGSYRRQQIEAAA